MERGGHLAICSCPQVIDISRQYSLLRTDILQKNSRWVPLIARCVCLLQFLLLLFLSLGSIWTPMGKREPSLHSRLESKSIMRLEVAFTWIQIPKSPETLFNHASLIEQWFSNIILGLIRGTRLVGQGLTHELKHGLLTVISTRKHANEDHLGNWKFGFKTSKGYV